MQLPGNVLVSAVKSHTAHNPSTTGGLAVGWLYQCQVRQARLRLGVVFNKWNCQSQKKAIGGFQTNLYLELLAGFGLHTSGPVEVNVLSVLASRTETELCLQKETWWALRCSGNSRPVLKFSDYSFL